MTLTEIVVVILIIGVLLAILIPHTIKHPGSARTVVCLSNIHSIGNAIFAYAAENDVFPAQIRTPDGGAARFNDPDGQKPNVLATVLATQRGTSNDMKLMKLMYCPLAEPWTKSPDLQPTPASNTSYLFNGVAAGTSLAKISKPTKFILAQEDRFATNTCFLRPYADSTGSFVFWSQRDPDNDAASQFGAVHPKIGNYLYADGHAESQKRADLRPADFGLIPGGPNPGTAADNWQAAVAPHNASSKTYAPNLKP